MSGVQPFQRWVGTTRGQVLVQLRGGDKTVAELAVELDLTENAVRSHLTSLERDGLIEAHGVRREGVGKPAVVFRLTPAGEEAFPKGYATVLVALLKLLAARFGAEGAGDLLREAGRLVVATVERPDAWEDRVALAQRTLEPLGGHVAVRRVDDTLRLEGDGCPLSQVVQACPEACQIVEQLLGEVLGCPVRETCDRSGRPRCVFVVEPPS